MESTPIHLLKVKACMHSLEQSDERAIRSVPRPGEPWAAGTYLAFDVDVNQLFVAPQAVELFARIVDADDLTVRSESCGHVGGR